MDDFNARDLFAGLAMIGLVNKVIHEDLAATAYEIADAMLKEKEKRDETP